MFWDIVNKISLESRNFNILYSNHQHFEDKTLMVFRFLNTNPPQPAQWRTALVAAHSSSVCKQSRFGNTSLPENDSPEAHASYCQPSSSNSPSGHAGPGLGYQVSRPRLPSQQSRKGGPRTGGSADPIPGRWCSDYGFTFPPDTAHLS